jgi:hypothetical protein
VRARDERGQLTVLIIGFTAIDLAQLADGAALAGTRGVSGSVVVRGIELSQSAAEHEVALYLDSVDRGGYDNLSWAVTVDGAEVAVHLQAVADLPLVMPGTTGTATVSADGSALLSQG